MGFKKRQQRSSNAFPHFTKIVFHVAIASSSLPHAPLMSLYK